MTGFCAERLKALDEDRRQALTRLAAAGAERGISLLLVGATARDLLTSVHGVIPERYTLDVDIAVMVTSWEEYAEFCAHLIARGFHRHTAWTHRFSSGNGVLIDILPCGGLADEDGCIFWPPDQNPKMYVTGFDDAFRHSQPLRLEENVFVNLISLPGLVLLKLLAWEDRRYATTKDAQDLTLLLRLYGEIHQTRLFDSEQDLFERHGFDLETAGAELLGRDIRTVASPGTKRHLWRILLEHSREQTPCELLVQHIARHLPGRNYATAWTLLSTLQAGLAT